MDQKDTRYQSFCKAIDTLDDGVALINAYDALLHDYDGEKMYQAESQMIKAIGSHQGITAAQLAESFGKTASACSQLIRKLKNKGWVQQQRNPVNSREYNLFLSQEGKEIFEKHRKFEEACYQRTFKMLGEISEADLQTYIRIQQCLNRAFALDVEKSRML